MEIKILGVGCPNCKKFEKNICDAISDLGIKVNIEKVEDMEKIANLGVMSLPGLVVNDDVVSTGMVLPIDNLKNIFKKYKD